MLPSRKLFMMFSFGDIGTVEPLGFCGTCLTRDLNGTVFGMSLELSYLRESSKFWVMAERLDVCWKFVVSAPVTCLCSFSYLGTPNYCPLLFIWFLKAYSPGKFSGASISAGKEAEKSGLRRGLL